MTTMTAAPVTLSVEEAGRVLGLSRNGAYRAVNRGEIPVVRIGRKLRVPTHRLVELLDGNREAVT